MSNDLIETAKSFEVTVEAKNEKITKLSVAFGVLGLLVGVLCTVALIMVLPLKETIVKVVGVDALHGNAEIITTLKEKEITEKEATAKYFSNLYVRIRESYNYFSLNNEYNMVRAYSSGIVENDYLALFNSEFAPDKVYRQGENIVYIKIISNQIGGAKAPDILATIRFKKTVRNLKTNQVMEHYFVARVVFRFEPHKKMTEELRNTNPLGFVVTSYQVDEELPQ